MAAPRQLAGVGNAADRMRVGRAGHLAGCEFVASAAFVVEPVVHPGPVCVGWLAAVGACSLHCRSAWGGSSRWTPRRGWPGAEGEVLGGDRAAPARVAEGGQLSRLRPRKSMTVGISCLSIRMGAPSSPPPDLLGLSEHVAPSPRQSPFGTVIPVVRRQPHALVCSGCLPNSRNRRLRTPRPVYSPFLLGHPLDARLVPARAGESAPVPRTMRSPPRSPARAARDYRAVVRR